MVHMWSLTIDPWSPVLPGTRVPYHVPTGGIQHFDPNYGLERPQSTSVEVAASGPNRDFAFNL